MDFSNLDLIVFLIYVIGTVGFGVSFYFRKQSTSDYITGSGKIPSWVLGMSIFATYVSSISFLALPGASYQSNWNGFVFSLSIPIAAWIAVRFFMPIYRKINSPSAYAYLEQRFGLWARVYASICYLLTQLARMGAIMYLLALPMEAFFGWSIPWIILFTGLAVICYSMLGGIKAVVWTDAIQGVILIIGALGCLITILNQLPGGWLQAQSVALEQGKFSLGSFGLSLSESTFWVILVYGLFINLQNFGVDQSYIQRYLGAKSDKEASKSIWLGSLLYIPVSLLFFMIGTALFVYFQVYDELLPAELGAFESADKVFPYFIVSTLPSGLTGLMVAAIFAAGMSTISTSVNSSATVILEDHFKKYILKNPNERTSLRILYISSFVMGSISIGVGLAFNGVVSALETWWALASIFSGGILGLFLLGLFRPTLTKISALLGVIAGVLHIGLVSWGYLPVHKNLAIVLGTMAIILVGFLFGLIVKEPRDFQENYR
ncbi:putative sialic acid transporter [Indibacter alkaliphilus LW1]|uniref:Sialic acid transporter n=1 Tax=Indibacter alkaliphilus (strain CCUG 57479 / KCTC 22604 / LW1) TaxID=1189612 RepID=S2DQX0_INDAL|nr:sodium:solute symporter [Indibacter alkaliphilus]EOZ92303.1 putative sialic acid transporter [Indibacter alkaliphilus LW1]